MVESRIKETQMTKLFRVGLPVINNIFDEEKLNKKVDISKLETTTKHGAIEGLNRRKLTNFYNLDTIIALGYRSNSKNIKLISSFLVFDLYPKYWTNSKGI